VVEYLRMFNHVGFFFVLGCVKSMSDSMFWKLLRDISEVDLMPDPA